MNQFIQRIANYVANEVIIKGLAGSKTFQKFAVKADANMRTVHKTGTETLDEILKQTIDTTATTSARGPPQPPLRGFSGFVAAFMKEVRKDFGGQVDKVK